MRRIGPDSQPPSIHSDWPSDRHGGRLFRSRNMRKYIKIEDQVKEGGTWIPVDYISYALTDYEAGYSPIERMTLAQSWVGTCSVSTW